MTTLHQEIVQHSEHEAQEVDRSSPESPSETTKELFRRDLSPPKNEIGEPQKSPRLSPTSYKSPIKQSITKKESPATKKSNSGIPLPLKSAPSPMRSSKVGGYRHSSASPLSTIINKNTLEVQFLNNKKRLLQMHAELVDKQRPLVEMHKSLLRTKKQLEDLGKKVVLEDLKIISMKTDDAKNQSQSQLDGSGENPAAEAGISLKNSIEFILEKCLTVCKQCFTEHDQVVKMLESASKSTIEPLVLEAEVEELKKGKDELEKSVELTLKENEKKIAEVITNWQNAMKSRIVSTDAAKRIAELEETIKQLQKSLQEADDNLHSVTRKFEDKKSTFEKTLAEIQEKHNKVEEDLKKEKKNANDNLMKSRTLRSKMTELEIKTKETDEKSSDAVQKLKQLQEQMRRKEIQWMKEKDDFKKHETLLQQKLAEKQSQFDARCQDFDKIQKVSQQQQQSYVRNLETQMEIKNQEFENLEKEKDELDTSSKKLEQQIEELEMQLLTKDKEVDEMNVKNDFAAAIDYKPTEQNYVEIMEYKQKVLETQSQIDQLNDQVNKMQSSLKAHAKLAAALKLEKDNAVKYSEKLRDVLQEAKDELEYKNKTIYKIHEKLVLREKAYDKLRAQLTEYEACSEYSEEKWSKNRCQICMAAMGAEKTGHARSCVESEVGKSYISCPQYVSESLIGMSVKKVDHLRARLDNLKKLKLPLNPGKSKFNVHYTWSQHKPAPNLRKQIELRGKLYQILQKHADQSCEDFINLLKLTVSNGGRDELKPSNMKDIVDETLRNAAKKFSSNMQITDSFTAISEKFGTMPISELYETLTESPNSDTEDFGF